MNETILGLDPGVSGGIAVIWAGGLVEAHRMPATEKEVLELLQSLKGDGITVAFMELVQPGGLHQGRAGEDGKRRTMGAKSAFTFGYGNGLLKGCLLACGYRIEMVSPAVWQSPFRLPSLKVAGSTTKKKNAHKQRAEELFPGVKVTHAVTDALLIAEYGRRLRAWTAKRSRSSR